MQDRILDRIRGRGPSKVFTPRDFADLGSRNAADQALSRLVRAGEIQRLGRGLYYLPRLNQRLGIPIGPDIDEIADAVGRQTGSLVAPSGALAANRLGLSTQVPAKPVYLTDGPSRTVRVGNWNVTLRHIAPKELRVSSRLSAMVFQALRFLGKDAIDGQVVARLRQSLAPKQRQALLRDARHTTGWIAEIVRRVGQDETEMMAHG